MINKKILSDSAKDFIDDDYFAGLIVKTKPDKNAVRDIISKSMSKQALSTEETAMLLAADRELTEEIFDAARELKKRVYGNRIVLFAPLYIGNKCINDCAYCAFRSSNKESLRRTLSPDEIAAALTDQKNSNRKAIHQQH